jgi:Cd2+/Zn2+-exporting ATPase
VKVVNAKVLLMNIVQRKKSNKTEKAFWIYLATGLGLTILMSTLLSLLTHDVLPGLYLPLLNKPATISEILYYTATLLVASYVGYIGLGKLIAEKRFSVEFLMAVAAFGAMYLGFLFEGATVLFLYSLAEYFEKCIEDRARKTIEKLSSYMPEKTTVIERGLERKLAVKDVQPKMTILIKPGERIPLDGVVIDGFSYVDQSVVTGESTPVFKKKGDVVYAGTLSTDGVLKVEVTKGFEETLISKIVKLVTESRKRKATMERLVDRFTRIYVPIVISLSVFTAAFMPWIIKEPYQPWLYRSLILLVVSCPSAFVVSVPATFFVAITSAAKKGIIIKGGVYLEKMAKVKVVMFDKTGTLTLGKPAVKETNCLGENADQRALKYAAALEQYSNHPIAESIVRKASELNLQFHKLDVKDVKEIPGKGVVGYVAGCRVAVGNRELMKAVGVNDLKTAHMEDDKHIRVYVSIDQCAPPVFCLVDEVRSDAAKAVKALREEGTYTVMLTGDKNDVAQEIAEKLSMNEVYAELFPEDKLKIIAEFKSKHGMVAMVGDGINDAPALAASDVGIAMGAEGVDVALESADIVLVKDELVRIPYLQGLSKRTVKIAKENIAISLGVKLILGALGFLGLIPLWFAVASGDDGVTLLLLLNTLRLTR